MKSFEQWFQEQKKYDIEYTKPEPVTVAPKPVPFTICCSVCDTDISSRDWVIERYEELRSFGMVDDNIYQEIDSDRLLRLCGGSPRCCP